MLLEILKTLSIGLIVVLSLFTFTSILGAITYAFNISKQRPTKYINNTIWLAISIMIYYFLNYI